LTKTDFQCTQVGEALPKGWAATTLGELRQDLSKSIEPKANPDQEYELYSVPSFELRNPEITYGSDIGSAKRTVQKDVVLLCKINPRINRVWVVGDHTPNAKIASTEWIPFFPLPGLNPRFLSYFMQRHEFRDYLATNVSGVGGSLMRVKSSTIEPYPFPLPPLNEQRRIVEKIEELFTNLDAGIQSMKQTQALLKSYRRSVLKAAVEGDLSREWREEYRDELEPASELLERILQERRGKFSGKKYKEPASPDTSKLPALPEGWVWATWGQVGISQNGRAFPSKEYSSSGIKLLRPGNLHADGFVQWTDKNTRYMPEKWAEEYPSYLVGPRELVINLTAQSLADEFLGRVCLTGGEEHCLLNQRIARLTPINVLPKYLLWMFKSHVFRRYVDSLNTGSLIQHMFTSQIAEFALPLPTLDEQRILVEEVERRFSVVDNLEAAVEANLRQAEVLRQSIFEQAFSGELVPQDPDDEPASVLLERIGAERESVKPKSRQNVGRARKNVPAAVTPSLFPEQGE